MKMEARNKFEAEISEIKKEEYIKQGKQEAIEKLRQICERIIDDIAK